MATYECPNFGMLNSIGPRGMGDFVFLEISAKPLLKQKAWGRAAVFDMNAGLGKEVCSWKILVSQDIIESISHTWSKYDSMAGKLQEATDLVVKPTAEALSLNKDGIAGLATGKSLQESEAALVNTFKNTNVVATKADAAIVYQDSANRQYNIEFELHAYKDAKTEVFDPIRSLFEYSCADVAQGDFLSIKLPHVFSIRVGKAMELKYAALVAVQPTWKFPWKNGYPMHASVSLTFMEIPPLYRTNIDGKVKVTTNSITAK